MKIRLPWILALALLVLGLLLGWWWFNSAPRNIQDQAVARREIALRVLAEYLAQTYSGKTALVISNPFSKLDGQPDSVYDFEKAGISGLERGWSDKVRLAGVAFPLLREGAAETPEKFPIDPETKTPLSFLTMPGAWDSILEQYPTVDLIVSLIGLPIDLTSLTLWRNPRPQLALLFPDLRMVGGRDSVRAALQSGKLAALVLNRPGAPPESTPLDPDYRKEFDRFFVLVTGENFEKIAAEWPQAI